VLLKAFALPVIKVAGAGLFIASLADLMDKRGDSEGSAGYANTFLPNDSPATAIPIADQEPHNPRASAARFGVALAVMNPDAMKDPGLQAIASDVQSLELDLDEFGTVLYAGGDWLYNASHYLHMAAQAKGISNEALALFDANLAGFLGSQIDIAAGGDETFRDSTRAQLAAFVREDLGWALANAKVDLVTPYQIADNGFAATVTDFQDFSRIDSALRATLDDARFTGIRSLIQEALATSEAAWQTVVVAPGHSANPFDDPAFHPEQGALPTGELREGSAETFTAYLPYEAPAGGQHIRFTLGGAAAEKLSVLADEESEIGADGSFTLTVAEGQRELSFQITALEDVDIDETLTLSAQLIALVDGAQVATHVEHEELKLALHAQDETAPAGGMELHGDWGIKLYPSLTADGTPILDANGNQVFHTRFDLRYPPFTNLERDPDGADEGFEQGHALTGLDGADHIWLGEFGGSGWAIGMGGDDYFEGMRNVPNLIIGDHPPSLLGPAGNDTIEGGENLRPYSAPGFTREGEHIEGIGDDILHGGAGDDAIYADRIALLEQTLDPTTPALDQKGDWITGGQGDDRIFGSAAHDVLFGGGGADEIHGGAGNDVLDGDDNYFNWGDAWWEVDAGFFGVSFFPVTSVRESWFEYYKEFGGDDVLDGGAGDDLIFGMLGNDTLIGGSGNDRLEGWEGNDQLFGGADDDVLVGDFGRYEVPWFRRPGANLRVMPGAVGLLVGDGSMVEQVGNDFLDGGAGNDQLFGEAGDDTLLGREGDDILFGDADYLPEELHGNDLLDGGNGADRLSGNAGDDRLFGGAGDDWLSGDAGNDRADGGPGDDIIFGGEGDDVLEGGEGADVLAGDAGSDVLRGDAGADSLDGGAGADSLYGGSGEDVLSGGEGNDVLDGGAGIDVLRGGAGDDTYVLGLGYGQDLIEDGEGSNRLRFGAGIAPDDLSATLHHATLSATISFGGAGDSATLNMGAFQAGGVEFAGGATWGRREFLGFMPALVSAGSDLSEVLVGNENLRNELRGLGGDDDLTGSANDDLLDGGAGADNLDGRAGSDVYVFAASDGETDTLADSHLQARAYLDWYYGNLGIPDWIERGQYAGKYKSVLTGWGFTEYYDSLEDAFAADPFAQISLVEPLPSAAPLVRRDDQAAIDQLVSAGVLSRDVVEFGPGLALSDLTLSITVNAAEAAGHPDQPWHSGGTLSVAWGDGGFDLGVPGVHYGFVGSNLLTDGSDPASDMLGAWRGYRLGEGIEAFRFDDGTTYSLEEVLRQAAVIEVVSDYRFSHGAGAQLISRNYASIVFDPDIRSDEVSVSRDGTDLLITLNGGGAQGRIAGWYDNAQSMPSLSLKFSSDPDIDAAALTEMGLAMVGSDGDDVIAGLDDFDDVLSGGAGSDSLDGGTGKDTYVFNRGDGIDTITDAPSDASGADSSIVVLGAGIDADQLQLRLGSLVLNLGGGDEIHFSAFAPEDPYAAPVFERLEFDDGTSMSYLEVLELGLQFSGSEADDVIVGTSLDDSIHGGAGNDVLSGLGGEDSLRGDDGDDTLAGGPGNDFLEDGEGNDTYVFVRGDGYDWVSEWDDTPGESDTVRLAGGILPADVHVTRDLSNYYLVLGGGDVLVLDSMARESAAEIERIEFDDGTVWTDLAARVELLPGTQGNDVLWGTAQGDVIHGLGGEDELFGNGGDDFMAGGEGSDIYVFAPGDGIDVVDNYDEDGSPDQIGFISAASADATLTRRGNDLVLTVASGSNEISLRDWYSDGRRKIDSVFFGGDFVSWDAAMLEELAPARGANNAPEVLNPLADHATLEDEIFSLSIPQDIFADADADELAYRASLLDGSELPAWLSFDPELQLFSGTPANGDVGVLEITLTATDAAGEAASDSFTLEVVNANDAPAVAGVIPDVRGRQGDALAFHVPPQVFTDPDANDHLSLSAAMANGSALPGWLSFDGTSFSGTPGVSDAGEYVIKVTASDDAGATADTSFRLMVDETPAPDLLVGTRHKDVLNGTAADEVLVGLGGNDLLRGGMGNDVYVHGLRDGHDEIVEAGGDFDRIRFGEGITRDMVRARRQRDDLVLDVAGPHGSVTVTGWFASQARRVELVQFAGGALWDEETIRRLVRKGDGGEGPVHSGDSHAGRESKPVRSAKDDRQALVDWYQSRDPSAAAIRQRLAAHTAFDFDALLREPGSRQAAPNAQEIARQWARAHSYASALAFESDESETPGWQGAAATLAGISAAGFGFEASIGAARAQEGLRGLEGLTEGFRKL
jgi:Ca2+-binding RTX toxin-like protein